MTQYQTVSIIGVGLIGGSIGMAIRERGLSEQVVGIGRREVSLAEAKKMSAIDQGTTDLAKGVKDADLIVVCAPVQAIPLLVEQAFAACPSNTVVTDAGSTKATLLDEIEKRVSGRQNGPSFVGSHPMAGDHRTGPRFARADLFQDRTVVVTPSEETDAESCQKVSDFWKALGARVLRMSPEEHDQLVAITSHLPHVVAYVLSATTPESAGPLAAKGWQDTTRIAAADPELWQQIFSSNKQSLLDALQRFEQNLANLRAALEAGDEQELTKLLQEAKRIRDTLGS